MQTSNEKTMLALKSASTEVMSFVTDAEKEVAKIEEQYATVVPDAESKEGYKFCKEVRKDVLPIKTALENARKQLKDPVLKMGKLIDGNIKPLTDRLEAVYKPFVDAYQEVDNRKKRLEEERQMKIQQAFDKLNNSAMEAIGQTALIIESIIEDVECFDFDPEVFQERTDEAIAKQAELIEKLNGMLEAQKRQEEFEAKQREMEERERKLKEAEQAEQARLAEAERQKELELERQKAREQAEKEAAEREARIKEEAAQAEIRAKEREKQLKLEAERQAKEAAEMARAEAKAEQERIEREKAEEAARLEANKKHVGMIRGQSKDDLISLGLSEDDAKKVVLAISQKQIRNLFIQY